MSFHVTIPEILTDELLAALSFLASKMADNEPALEHFLGIMVEVMPRKMVRSGKHFIAVRTRKRA